jgi:hypothetical protein
MTRALIRALLGVAVVISAAFFDLASLDARPSSQHEALSARQHELLRHSLAALQPAPARQPQIYFVGFAGYGRQAVFKREVLAVQQLFDDRFGTAGRSVTLVNHPSTAHDIPLASIDNLDSVLQQLGRLMDPRRDTLFLFVSSHGEPGSVAVEMPGLQLRQLRPDSLKRMLERSGIMRRVIVISSCHSGSFIPPLADPNTLVIAASRSDRSSFGCEDRRQWTYFGDAYFNQALRRDTSFRNAFEHARQLITRWEERDQLEPSLPQIGGGEALTDMN